MKRIINIVFMVVSALAISMSSHGMNKKINEQFYPQSLDDFSETGKPFGASVLPYYEEKGHKYVLLGRELNSRNKRWMWFSGGSIFINGKVEHPTQTAAREFYEEAILNKTLGLHETEVKDYIEKNVTEIMACYSRVVAMSRPLITYLVKFQKNDIEKIIETFKSVFDDKDLEDKFKEKNALAVINFKDLIMSIKNNKQRVTLDKNLPHWFSKDEEKEILIPWMLLRAYYAPEETFKVFDRRTKTHKEYHYVQDKLPHDLKNYKFFAQEEVKQIKSKL